MKNNMQESGKKTPSKKRDIESVVSEKKKKFPLSEGKEADVALGWMQKKEPAEETFPCQAGLLFFGGKKKEAERK